MTSSMAKRPTLLVPVAMPIPSTKPAIDSSSSGNTEGWISAARSDDGWSANRWTGPSWPMMATGRW